MYIWMDDRIQLDLSQSQEKGDTIGNPHLDLKKNIFLPYILYHHIQDDIVYRVIFFFKFRWGVPMGDTVLNNIFL